MIIDCLDERPGAWRCMQNVPHQLEIDLMMRGRIARRVHQLDREIDALCRGVGELGCQDILLAQDRHLAVDQQARALVGIGDHAIADNDALAGLELDFQGHEDSSSDGIKDR